MKMSDLRHHKIKYSSLAEISIFLKLKHFQTTECSSQDHFEISDCLTYLYIPLINDLNVYWLVWGGCSLVIRALA